MIGKFFQNNWLKWAVILIIAFAYITNPKLYKDDKKETDKKQENKIIDYDKLELEKSENSSDFINDKIESLVKSFAETEKGKALLDSKVNQELVKKLGEQNLAEAKVSRSNKINIIDSLLGEGDEVVCGSLVTISYTALMPAGIKFDSSKDRNKPLKFIIGAGKVIKGLEQGMLGMKQGGLRKITIPPNLAFDDKRFKNNLVPEGTVVTYEVELLETARVTKADLNNIEYYTRSSGLEQSAKCGSTVTISYTNRVPEEDAPAGKTKTVQFTIGKGDVPMGLEQSVIGMLLGEIRTIIIRPELLKTLSQKSLIKIPKEAYKNNMIIEAELISTN